MATVTSLNPYSFAFNGFVFGGSGSPYQITSVDGIAALPSINSQDDNKGYQDGMFTGRDFLRQRNIMITIQVFGTPSTSMQTNLNALTAALQPQQQGTGILQFQIPGSNLQQVKARVRKRSIKIDPEFTYGKAIATYEFFSPDPLIYDSLLHAQDVFSANPVTGRTYNRTYNMTYGAGFANGILNNSGNTTTYPLITITGPCVNPQVNNISSGQFLKINYTLAISDTLILDTQLRTVTLNGVNRRALLDNSSSWFALSSGTSYYTFVASGTGTGTSCVVSWQNAYI